MREETRYRHMGYSFPINSKGSFICTIPQTGLHKPRPERLPNFPPLMNVLKRVFFDGAYIEKWGMVFWGESNKEEFFFFFFLLWP